MVERIRVVRIAATLALAGAGSLAALDFESCRLGEGLLHVEADCATLKVPENYEAEGGQQGRQLELPLAIRRATSREKVADPIVLLAGGPGQAATEAFLQLLPALRRLNDTRDLVMLDQRGTGKASLLVCEAFADEEESDAVALDPTRMVALAQRCVAEINAKADPSRYTTVDAARDLEALRVALGADRLNLYGVSYGTRLAQVYATMYPTRVRTVILDGVVPLDLAFGPRIGTDAQAAIDRILGRCAENPACSGRFPDLANRLRAALASLETAPQTITVSHPSTGQREPVTVTREAAAQVLRLMTYAPETAALVPLIVDSIARGELESLAGQWLVVGEGILSSMNQALSLSVLCAEDVPFFDPAALAASTSSFLRDDVPKALAATCPSWPSRAIDAATRAPFAVDVPTLLLSGELDPVTPPEYGDRVAATTPNGRHLVAPGMGHNVLPRGCMPKLVEGFIDTADSRSIDAKCLEDLTAPEPFLSPAGPALPPAKEP